MKKFFVFNCIILAFSCCLFTSCEKISSSTPVKIANNDTISSEQLTEFIEIDEFLVYNPVTRIVYMKYYSRYTGYYILVPCYAPNGLPYKYNPETNTLEENNVSIS